jgi:hypothetical protein
VQQQKRWLLRAALIVFLSKSYSVILIWTQPSFLKTCYFFSDICKTIRDLKTSTGIYVKSACTVYLNYDQSTARSTCRANGMQLYTVNTIVEQTVLLAYADSQWPYNELWIEGGNATSCYAISNFNRTNFRKISVPCSNNTNYFYCEYKSKLCLNHNSIVHFYKVSLISANAET